MNSCPKSTKLMGQLWKHGHMPKLVIKLELKKDSHGQSCAQLMTSTCGACTRPGREIKSWLVSVVFDREPCMHKLFKDMISSKCEFKETDKQNKANEACETNHLKGHDQVQLAGLSSISAQGRARAQPEELRRRPTPRPADSPVKQHFKLVSWAIKFIFEARRSPNDKVWKIH